MAGRSGARIAAAALLAAAFATAPPRPAVAVGRDTMKDARAAYEGRTFRLRLDLRSSAHAIEPNILSLAGMGYGSEGSPVLFHRLETVFVERVTSEGGSRVALAIYRDAEESRNLRAAGIPPPSIGNMTGPQPMVLFARAGSTTVILDLAAGRKDADAQRREITALMERLFYIDSEPTPAEIEAFVLEHRDWPVSRLSALTGLTPDEVRALVTGAPRPPG